MWTKVWCLVFLSAFRYPIWSPIIIVTIWNVVFANKSRKLGWIWMKLGRWSWGLKRLSLARFQRNHTMGFGESAKKWVAVALFFLSREPRTTCATFLGSISAKLPTNTCPGGASRHTVSYSRKVSIKGSNLPKNPLFRVPCLCSAYGSREMFCDAYTLSIPYSVHPTDLSFLGDFCWGIYHFPAIHLGMCPYQQWRYLDGDTVAPPGERRGTTQ